MNGDIVDAETTDAIVKIVQMLAKTAPNSTHSALQQYLASSGQCITLPPATHSADDSTTKGRLVPVIVSFRSHNLGHSDPKKDLDKEIHKLRDFFRRHLHLDTVHILVGTVWESFSITYDSDMKLKDISAHDTILLVYLGHGHRDKATGIWYMNNGYVRPNSFGRN